METAGSVPAAMSEYRFGGVLNVRRRTWSGCDMIEVSYWNGLQILQYSSALRPVGAIVELVGIVDIIVPLVAVVFPGDFASFRSSPMLGVEEGGIVNGVLAGIVIGIGVVAVAEIARVVIVEQVVMALLAPWIDRRGSDVR